MIWRPFDLQGPYLKVPGRVVTEGQEDPIVAYQRVMPGYFSTIGTRILQGGAIEAADGAGSQPVAVVNQQLAESYFGGQPVVGQRIAFGRGENVSAWVTIVGLAEDAKIDGLRDQTLPAAYISYAQHPAPYMVMLLRSGQDPASLAPSARQTVWSVDSSLPISIRTMDEIVSLEDWETNVFSWAFSVFSLLAVVLAMVGLYGVITYSVSRRRSEIGVRMALGARASDVLRLIMGSGIALVAGGLALGMLGALAVSEVLSSFLVGVSATDPTTFLITALLLLAVSVLAAYLPARRATRIDPLYTLRAE